MKQNLRLSILRVLEVTPAGYSMLREPFMASLRLAHYPEPTASELEQAINRLEADNDITITVDDFDGYKYALTDKGRIKVASR